MALSKAVISKHGYRSKSCRLKIDIKNFEAIALQT